MIKWTADINIVNVGGVTGAEVLPAIKGWGHCNTFVYRAVNICDSFLKNIKNVAFQQDCF